MRSSPTRAYTCTHVRTLGFSHTYTQARLHTHRDSHSPPLSPPGPCPLPRPSMTQGSQKGACATSWVWHRFPHLPAASSAMTHRPLVYLTTSRSWVSARCFLGQRGREAGQGWESRAGASLPRDSSGVGVGETPSGNQRDLLACGHQVSPAQDAEAPRVGVAPVRSGCCRGSPTASAPPVPSSEPRNVLLSATADFTKAQETGY